MYAQDLCASSNFMDCNFKCSVSKLAQICQFSLRTGSFVRKLGKREKERRGGGVRGREIENEPAGMTFNLESFAYHFSMLKS